MDAEKLIIAVGLGLLAGVGVLVLIWVAVVIGTYLSLSAAEKRDTNDGR